MKDQRDVYFDDITVMFTPSAVVQQEDYYPFGLAFNSFSRQALVPQNYEFNGIEAQVDLGLNVSQAFFRTMDPAIGRWWQIDPKVESYVQLTPYNMMGNNPINVADPLGDEWVTKKDAKIDSKLTKSLNKTNGRLAKTNSNLDKQIVKAEKRGTQKK